MVVGKKFVLISLSVFVIILAFLAIGDIDYSISKAIINKDSIWAEFFNMFGEFPAIFGLLLGTILLYGGRNREILWWNIVSSILGVIFITLFSYAVVIMPVNYTFEHSENGIPTIWGILSLILALVLAVVSFSIAHTKGEHLKELKKNALLLIVLIISEVIVVNIFKGVWARPRMRSITDISEFKHWYEISGWTNDNELKSFPSGHTANGFVAIAYMTFIPYIKNVKLKNYMILAITWGVLVALSRVVLGAHFLSDVLVGGYITIFLFILWESIIIKSAKNV